MKRILAVLLLLTVMTTPARAQELTQEEEFELILYMQHPAFLQDGCHDPGVYSAIVERIDEQGGQIYTLWSRGESLLREMQFYLDWTENHTPTAYKRLRRAVNQLFAIHQLEKRDWTHRFTWRAELKGKRNWPGDEGCKLVAWHMPRFGRRHFDLWQATLSVINELDLIMRKHELRPGTIDELLKRVGLSYLLRRKMQPDDENTKPR